MKRLFNPIWRLLTTVKIYAVDENVMWDTWHDEYAPFGYVMKKLPYEKGPWHIMIVCKDLGYGNGYMPKDEDPPKNIYINK